MRCSLHRRPGSGIAAAAVLALLSMPTATHAFNYQEHERITRKALRKTPEFLRQAGDDVSRWLEKDGFCSPEILHKAHETALPCLLLSDVTPLADHAATLGQLLERWQIFRAPSGAVTNVARNATSILVNAGGDCSFQALNLPDLLVLARRKAPLASAYETAARDGMYGCLATGNSSHFRLHDTPLLSALEGSRPNAVRTYAQYHLAALAFAAAAGRHQNPDTSSRLRALSVLLELFGLHFLQDGVSAGHMATPRILANPTTALATHDKFSEDGLPVSLAKLCTRHQSAVPSGSALEEICRQNGQQATFFGDGLLDETKSRPTFEAASLLSSPSMQQVAEAWSGGAGEVALPSECAPLACLEGTQHYLYECERLAMAKDCLDKALTSATGVGARAWLASDTPASSSPNGYVAISSLPEPVMLPAPAEYFTGLGLTLSSHGTVRGPFRGGSLFLGISYFLPSYARHQIGLTAGGEFLIWSRTRSLDGKSGSNPGAAVHALYEYHIRKRVLSSLAVALGYHYVPDVRFGQIQTTTVHGGKLTLGLGFPHQEWLAVRAFLGPAVDRFLGRTLWSAVVGVSLDAATQSRLRD